MFPIHAPNRRKSAQIYWMLLIQLHRLIGSVSFLVVPLWQQFPRNFCMFCCIPLLSLLRKFSCLKIGTGSKPPERTWHGSIFISCPHVSVKSFGLCLLYCEDLQNSLSSGIQKGLCWNKLGIKSNEDVA